MPFDPYIFYDITNKRNKVMMAHDVLQTIIESPNVSGTRIMSLSGVPWKQFITVINLLEEKGYVECERSNTSRGQLNKDIKKSIGRKMVATNKGKRWVSSLREVYDDFLDII